MTTALRPGMRVRDPDGNDVGWVERVQVRACDGREAARSLMQVVADALDGASSRAADGEDLTLRIVGNGHRGGRWADARDIRHVGEDGLLLAVAWDSLGRGC